jgi:limonene-1,2-epoxide hydrolase
MIDSGTSMDRRAFIGLTAMATAALGASAPLEAAELTETERANVKLVNDMCAAWVVPLDFERIGSFLADDCVFRASETSAPIKGRDTIVASLKKGLGTAKKAEFEVVQSFARGPIVFNERFDRFALGERSINWNGVGVFFIKDGKIAEWSDYTVRML